MISAITGHKSRKAVSERPAAWPCTVIMLLLGGAIPVIFIMGAIGNCKAENWLARRSWD